mmetsp:Transcript_43261/g.113663  ORF Transcript_43261/g.113663 Transcript_43261/m.113663 type:complete len:203 (+) Transcript_43261:985-1593(+)
MVRLPPSQLGRHVLRRTTHGAHSTATVHHCEPKVAQLDRLLRCVLEQDVLGLDVSMGNAHSLQVHKRCADLRSHQAGVALRQAGRVRSASELTLQRATRAVLEDAVQHALAIEKVDHVGYVFVRTRLQRAEHIEFILHGLHEVRLLANFRFIERFHCHLALRAYVACARHLAEGTLCNWAHGLIAEWRQRIHSTDGGALGAS